MNGEPDRRRGARALVPLLRLYPWAIPAIVALGVAASLAEGIGISLFIPLLQSVSQGADASSDPSWIGSAAGLFDGLSANDRLWAISGCIFAAVVVSALLTYLNTVLFSWLDARISYRLRSGIFHQLLSVEYRFVERSRFGKLMNTLATETWRTSDALAVLVTLITTVCSIVVYVSLLLLLSVEITVLVAVVMVVVSLIVRGLTRRAQRLGDETTAANAVLSDRMIEGLAGMQVIRAYGRETHEQDRFDEASGRVSRVALRLALMSGSVGPVYEVLSAALLVAVVLISLDDPANLATVLVFIFVLYRLQPRIKVLDEARVGLRTLAGAVDDVMALLDTSDKPYLPSGDIAYEQLIEAVEFDEVTYRYEPDEPPAVADVSLRIPARKVTALVGPSGAGKSTLVKLLFRFYDPSSGSVSVDGRPLPELDVASWRARLALVSQDVHLFNTTVRSNIAYGRPDATRAEVEEAARQADAHDFIMRLPQGYETDVGDRGVRLSGGQQQRITLARAIVRDPEILILDEATNSLDSLSERIIQDALDLLSEDRTVVMIAHRFSTIEQADHIVVLDDGRVSEQGSREELLARDGLFRRLHDLQHGGALS